MSNTINFTGTGGIIEGNLGAANVNVNLDSALYFSGGDGSPDSEKNVVTMGDVDLITTGDMTISAWIKPEAITSETVQGATIIGKQVNYNPNALGYGLYWRHSTNFIYYSVGDGSNGDRLEYDASALVDTWIHIAGTYNSSTKAMVLYVNGVSVDTGTATGVGDLTNSNILRLGGNGSEASNGDAYYKGYIADARLYFFAASQSYVQKLAAKINVDDPNHDSNYGMLGWWKSNDGSGSEIVDHHNVGTDYNGVYKRNNSAYSTDIWKFDEYSVDVYDNNTTTDGTFTITQGKVECLALSSLLLDGAGDHVDLASSFTLSHDGSTVAFWVKKDNATGNIDTIFGQAADQNQHWIQIKTNGEVVMRDYPNDLSTSSQIADTNWNHVVITMSGDTNGAIYFNGVSQPLALNQIVGDPVFDVIGIRGTIDEFDGKLRDLKVFDYALSAEQAASLYSGTYPQTAKHEWKMDEGTGATANDTGTGTAANGTLDGNASLGGAAHTQTLDLDGSLTIAANGTLSAPRGTLEMEGASSAFTFRNFATNGFIHNNGTVDVDGSTTSNPLIIDDDSVATTTFYNLTISNDHQIRTQNSITVENNYTLGSSTYGHIFDADTLGSKLTFTMGTSTEGGIMTLTDGKLRGANDSQVLAVVGACDTDYTQVNTNPFDFDFDDNGTWELKNLNFNTAITTDGNGLTLRLTGDCEFDAVTVSSGDTLDLNGQRAVFGGDFTCTGGGSPAALDWEDSLVIIKGHVDLNGIITTANSGTKIIHDTASEKNWRSLYADAGVFMSNGSQTTLVGYGWTSSGNEVTTIIPAATINTNNVGINTTNMTIPTGGTFQGQAQTLTVAGDFTTSGGLIGASAIDLNGSQQHYSTVSAVAVGTNSAWTIEGWMKRDDGSSGNQVFVELKTASNNNNRVWVNIDTDDVQMLIYSNGGSLGLAATANQGLNDGKWHHIAVTYDSTTCQIYVDGKLTTSEVISKTVDNTDDRIINVGANVGTYANEFTGAIDEVRIWDDVRTEAEIRANMFSEVSSGDGLVQNWRFNEGTGDTASANVGTSLNARVGGNSASSQSASLWAGAGTFTYGTSTVDMTGDGTWTYQGDISFYNFKVAAASKTTTYKRLSNGTINIANNLYIGAGSLTRASSVTWRLGYDGATSSRVNTGVGSILSGATDPIDFSSSYVAYFNDEAGTFNSNVKIEYLITSYPLTLTNSLEGTGYLWASNNLIDIADQTCTTPQMRMNDSASAAINIDGGTLNLTSTSATGGLYPTYASNTFTAGPGATITGPAGKATFTSQSTWEIVGNIENLNVTNEELAVFGQVTNCTGDIHQWLPHFERDVMLDADTSTDVSLDQGDDLDRNNELIN